MKKSWITREPRKKASTVNEEELDYPRAKKKSLNGQWRRVGWPVDKEKKLQRSMKKSWMARGQRKKASTVNEEELDYPRAKKKSFNGQ
ncbi:hypothetical protein [Neobacillus mesonae]|uniref:hypothetical protein n=1 Tax=Neobacillus mesonae TaxID=1193713 RepID=UPI00203F1F33|nr:hypothetical protein [Neobacillus mesonae]MCM3569490.1 hypothetical protein [Neobacillus mesonae]